MLPFDETMRRTVATAISADGIIPAEAGDEFAGGGVTPGLLLALTSLYVQRPYHTAEEQLQYTELALGLIDKAGPAARAAVAARLQRHPDAPAVVIERLGDSLFSQDGGVDRMRPHSAPDPRVQAGPPFDGDPSPDLASPDLASPDLAGQAASGGALPDAQSESTSAPPVPVPAARQPAPLTPESGEAFFAASPDKRRRILSEIVGADAAESTPGNGRRFHVRIDVAPWHGRTGAFARDFERLIDAPKSLCERILNDPSGEPMVVAARATGMPVAVLQRILLLVCPATHHSVRRVYDLTELYHGVDPRTASALLAAWREAARPDGAALQTPAAAVTNLRARLGALNARIESQVNWERALRPPAPRPARREGQREGPVTGSEPAEAPSS